MGIIILILFLIFLNGFFSLAEIALITARKAKLEISAKNGNKSATEALKLANDPPRFISTSQIGITVVSILIGIYSGDHLLGYLSPSLEKLGLNPIQADNVSFIIITMIVTFLTLIFGELVPKRIGLAKPETVAVLTAHPMNIITRIAYPFVWFSSQTTNFIVKLSRIKDNPNAVTEEEIKSMVQEGASGGTIEEIEHELVQNVFHLGDRRITSLMTSVNDISYIDLEDDPEENKTLILEKRHSIYPVSVDGLNDIKGLLYTKDLLDLSMEETLKNPEPILRPVLYIAESNRAYQVLEKFQQERIHFGIIVDEYGSVVGIVTLNDILDALVGDISDSNDFEFEIVEREDGSFLIDAGLPFDEFLTEFEIDLSDRKEYSGFDTMGGFAVYILNEIPKVGEKFDWRNFGFEILDMDKTRVDKMLVTIYPVVDDEFEEE